jgi:hypothetical protein
MMFILSSWKILVPNKMKLAFVSIYEFFYFLKIIFNVACSCSGWKVINA